MHVVWLASGPHLCALLCHHVQVWTIKLPNNSFAMPQKRVENLLHVTAVSVAAYVQVGGVDSLCQ